MWGGAGSDAVSGWKKQMDEMLYSLLFKFHKQQAEAHFQQPHIWGDYLGHRHRQESLSITSTPTVPLAGSPLVSTGALPSPKPSLKQK